MFLRQVLAIHFHQTCNRVYRDWAYDLPHAVFVYAITVTHLKGEPRWHNLSRGQFLCLPVSTGWSDQSQTSWRMFWAGILEILHKKGCTYLWITTNDVLKFQQHQIWFTKVQMLMRPCNRFFFFFFALTCQYTVKPQGSFLSNVFQTVTADKS